MNFYINKTKKLRTLVQMVFTIFTLFLIYQEFALYISIPVHSTHYKKKFSSDQFPDIFVCHIPGFNLDQLKRHSYRGSNAFLFGITSNKSVRSWIGNSTEFSTEEIIKDISNISSVDQCPPVFLGSSMIKLARLIYLSNPQRIMYFNTFRLYWRGKTVWLNIFDAINTSTRPVL